MKFSKVHVFSSCEPGFKMSGPDELAIWFDGGRRNDPVNLMWGQKPGEWIEWTGGNSIADALVGRDG